VLVPCLSVSFSESVKHYEPRDESSILLQYTGVFVEQILHLPRQDLLRIKGHQQGTGFVINTKTQAIYHNQDHIQFNICY
jgi:hypothetical protein